MNTGIKILISLIVGFSLGVAGTGIYIHHCFCHAWVNNENHKHTLKMLSTRLNLTPEQENKVEQIFDETDPLMESIRLETNAKLKTIRDSTSAQILSVLTLDQQKQFNILRSQWDKKINSDNKGWHIPGLRPAPPSSSLSGMVCYPIAKHASFSVSR